jgi:hypothetical protein
MRATGVRSCLLFYCCRHLRFHLLQQRNEEDLTLRRVPAAYRVRPGWGNQAWPAYARYRGTSATGSEQPGRAPKPRIPTYLQACSAGVKVRTDGSEHGVNELPRVVARRHRGRASDHSQGKSEHRRLQIQACSINRVNVFHTVFPFFVNDECPVFVLVSGLSFYGLIFLQQEKAKDLTGFRVGVLSSRKIF